MEITTSMQVSKELLEKLQKRKMFNNETYEDIIWNLLEDTMELSEETKRDIEESKKQYERGEYHKWEDVKKELKLDV